MSLHRGKVAFLRTVRYGNDAWTVLHVHGEEVLECDEEDVTVGELGPDVIESLKNAISAQVLAQA